MSRTITLVAVSLFLAACVSVNKSVLSRSRVHEPLPLEQVQVYFADDSVPGHERIAILNAEGAESFTDRGKIIDKLRQEAGKLGANAIILNELKDPGTGERVVAMVFGVAAMRKGSALAIYVREPDRPR